MASAQTRSDPPIGAFVAFLAAVFAMGSLGIDAVLPAFPAMVRDFHLRDPSQVQFTITSFAVGMGLGNLIGGPLSDAKGRRAIILFGCLLYAMGAFVGSMSGGIATLCCARAFQGIGAAFATVATTALARDSYSGATMARVMSYAMMFFAMMPAVAPFIGQGISIAFGWRVVFGVFAAFGGLLALRTWMAVADVNTERSGLSMTVLADRARQVLAFREVRIAIAAQACNFGILLSMLGSIQPVFEKAFDRAASFPIYFALMAVAIAVAGFVNGRIVGTVGAARLSRWALGCGTALAVVVGVALRLHGVSSSMEFPLFLLWATGTFFVYGFTMGNLNAIAMEPAGHLAGMASSLVASVPMLVGSTLSIPVGMAFDGTPVPLVLATTLFSGVAFLILYRLRLSEPRS
ncbi:Drug resistance transporter, Bcr/CflA subfamily [Novosphingobium resinovorum]|uniref:Drug resistance transporter, Bcr/CflA subfamily n=1 Tax=Novosphingobium resinovorum TaxID=158500 RepID=A0A031JBH7_9SPHN|nr:Drug resistance transporter, Bcr/CflA subfamily [Novosphingobium resinovorum]